LGCLLAAIVLGIGAYRTILPMLNRMRDVGDPLTWDARNMRQIGQALMLYARAHQGQYPPRLGCLLADGNVTTEVFVSPLSNDTKAMGDTIEAREAALESGGHESYIYVPNLNSSVDPRTVVLYEPLTDHSGDGMNVLFGDGHVEFDTKQQAAGMIAEIKAGFNPPRAGHY
jgi:prepilin-type processing-associated H-X9-DG protein